MRGEILISCHGSAQLTTFNLTHRLGLTVNGQRIGNVRVSSFDQNLDRHLEGGARMVSPDGSDPASVWDVMTGASFETRA